MTSSVPPLTAVAVLLTSIALLNVAIGLSVLRRNAIAPLNRAFACTALAVALWTAALAWGRLQPDLFFLTIRAAFAAGTLVPLGVVCFIEHFGPPVSGRRHRIRAIAALASAFAVLAFSPWIVTDVTREAYGMRPLYGFLHPLFAAYLVVG